MGNKKPKKEKIPRIFLVLVLLLVLSAVFLAMQKRKIVEGECNVDSDCAKQQVTCCSCNNGGKEECMSKQNATFWKEKLGKCERNIVCIALYNCKETNCICEKGKCSEE